MSEEKEKWLNLVQELEKENAELKEKLEITKEAVQTQLEIADKLLAEAKAEIKRLNTLDFVVMVVVSCLVFISV